MSQDVGMGLGNLVAWLFLQYSWASGLEEGRLRLLFEEERGDLVCGAQACPVPFTDTGWY